MSGRLAIVGIGPGDPGLLPPAGREELARADLVIGYRAYLDQLGPELTSGSREAYEIGEEGQRAGRAAAAAGAGARVALVSGGDAGVYGMAGLALAAVAALEGPPPEVAVVPGITAALAAAALLGAPLGVDFACLSLSDLLLPWPELGARIEALAAADVVLALYNPASGSRRRPWRAAVAAIRRHRPPQTPAAAVRRAYRDGQRVTHTTVARLGRLKVDMETLVIVGSSRTVRHRDWLLTLREPGRR